MERQAMTPTSPNLTFDDATHEYRIDGAIVPSITQVIGASNLWDDTHWSPETAERGRYVHKAIELDIQGKLTLGLVKHIGRLEGCIKSWRKFRADNPGKVVASELKLCDPVFRFAGRLDLIYRLCDDTFGIIDIKAGAPQPWHALQAAAQMHLAVSGIFEQRPAGGFRRMTLYLNETGYKVSVHDDPNDWAVFQSALTLAHWRTSNARNDRRRADRV
jgi:hypothetical protein